MQTLFAPLNPGLPALDSSMPCWVGILSPPLSLFCEGCLQITFVVVIKAYTMGGKGHSVKQGPEVTLLFLLAEYPELKTGLRRFWNHKDSVCHWFRSLKEEAYATPHP